MMSAAWVSFSAAWYSPSEAMILARRSRAASAWRPIALCICSGISTSLISTVVTLTPQGSLVDDLLQVLVEPLALGEQLIEIRLAEHRAQRGLGDLRGGEQEVLDLDDRLVRVDHPEVG